MNELTEKDREKLLTAGEICYKEMLQDIEQIAIDDIPISYDHKKIRSAETEAWQEMRRTERKAKIKRMAVLVTCLLLALTAVMLTGKPSVAYQKFFNNLFFKDNGNSISIVSSSTVLLPDNWRGCYLPAVIPYGYVIESAEKNGFIQSIFYVDADGNYIDFSANIGDFNVHVDTEDCIVENIIVGDKDGIIRIKYKNDEVTYKSISWGDDKVFFDVSSNSLSKETLLSIAESVMIAE